jgi:catechol 2,3-dioxygenase-like lactoylglutathione lyase family enzyme
MEKRRKAPPRATPHIFRVVLHVRNLATSVAFYAELLGAPGRRVSPGRHYFDCGGVTLALFDPRKEDGFAPRPSADNLYFAVKDLESVFARAEGLGCLSEDRVHRAPAGEIVTRPWGERSFYCVDPSGNALCFVDAATVFTGR